MQGDAVVVAAHARQQALVGSLHALAHQPTGSEARSEMAAEGPLHSSQLLRNSLVNTKGRTLSRSSAMSAGECRWGAG